MNLNDFNFLKSMSISNRRRSGAAALVLAAGALLASAQDVGAALVFSDDFSSADGGLVGTTPDVGSGNWAFTASAATPIQIVSGVAAVKSSGQDDYAPFTAPVSTATATSLTTNLDINVSAAGATGDYFSHLSSPAGTTSFFFQRLFARSSGAGFQLGLVDTSGTNSTTTWGAGVLNLSSPFKVTVKWNFVPGPTNDSFEVLVNGSSYLTHAWTSILAEPTDLAAANLRQGSAANAPTLTVDNLSVESTPIPEPATLALAGAGLIGLVACGRRK
jgi:hypothetical protein